MYLFFGIKEIEMKHVRKKYRRERDCLQSYSLVKFVHTKTVNSRKH